MTAINENELSSEELDAVSGGWFCFGFIAPSAPSTGCAFGNDKAVEFCLIMQQMTQG